MFEVLTSEEIVPKMFWCWSHNFPSSCVCVCWGIQSSVQKHPCLENLPAHNIFWLVSSFRWLSLHHVTRPCDRVTSLTDVDCASTAIVQFQSVWTANQGGNELHSLIPSDAVDVFSFCVGCFVLYWSGISTRVVSACTLENTQLAPKKGDEALIASCLDPPCGELQRHATTRNGEPISQSTGSTQWSAIIMIIKYIYMFLWSILALI